MKSLIRLFFVFASIFLFSSPGLAPLVSGYTSTSPTSFVEPSISSISIASTIAVGKHPIGIAYDSSTSDVYVTNNSSGTVSVIASSGSNLNKVIANIHVGKQPSDIIYNPVSQDIYVVNYGSASVSIISGLSLVKNVKVVTHPIGIFFDPANGDVYVTNSTSFSTATFTYSPSIVDRINHATFGVKKINLGVPASVGLFYDPANGAMYTSTSFFEPSSPELLMISSTTNALTKISMPSGTEPVVEGYSPANQELYIFLGNSLVALTKTNAISATINGVTGIFMAAYDPANQDMYFSNFSSSSVTGSLVIVGASNSLSRLKVGIEPSFILFDPANNEMYVTNEGSNSTFVVSSTSNTIVAKIADGQAPVFSLYNPADKDVFVVSIPKSISTSKGSVEVLSSTSVPTKVTALAVGKFPSSIVFDAVSSEVYVTNLDSNTVSAISS